MTGACHCLLPLSPVKNPLKSQPRVIDFAIQISVNSTLIKKYDYFTYVFSNYQMGNKNINIQETNF